MNRSPRIVAALLVAFALLFAPSRARANEKLRVIVPDTENLQYMTFWVAKAGGFFEREGIDVELVVAPHPMKAESMFEAGEGDAAVLPPPIYLRLVANKKPVVLVANLLQNDPINLVVRREVLEERKLTRDMPLKERILGLKGMKIGVAPHPPARLRALLATEGLDADKDIEMVVLLGKLQNPAFHDKKVDALYAHTPFLEKAIVDDGAVVLIEQSRGEVPALSNRLIHGFAFTRPVFTARRTTVMAAVRAIAEAQKSIHASPASAVEALAKQHPTRSRKELETIVALYEPAIPQTPDVKVEDLAPALALFPEGVPKPDLAGIDLTAYVASDVAPKAREQDDGRRGRWIVGAVALAVVLGIALALRKRRGATQTD